MWLVCFAERMGSELGTSNVVNFTANVSLLKFPVALSESAVSIASLRRFQTPFVT